MRLNHVCLWHSKEAAEEVALRGRSKEQLFGRSLQGLRGQGKALPLMLLYK